MAYLLLICVTVITVGQFTVESGYRGERQRYDGYYNNLANSKWGSAGNHLINTIPTSYEDFTYQPSGSERPSAREISNTFFDGPSGLPSHVNHTALFAFFSQLVKMEVVSSTTPTCPVELMKVNVPPCDQDFDANCSGTEMMPFTRGGYDKRTGKSPNNPRKQINEATSWIDGSFIYGTSEVWANCLRKMKDGKLFSSDKKERFPALNKIRLPLDNYPSPMDHELKNPETLWMFGSPQAHEHPGVMALSVVWFRWHNKMAAWIKEQHKNEGWKDEKIFHMARRWVIATFQNVVMYEWLPALLGEPTEPYSGYKNHMQPGINAVFEAAATRYFSTMMPPGIYRRDGNCDFKKGKNNTLGWRLCNAYWDSQTLMQPNFTKDGDRRDEFIVEETLQGIASQIAEREDHIVVHDLRGKFYGPLHYSRHDFVVQTLMRGRDLGLPNYSEARKYFGLSDVNSWDDFKPNINATKAQIDLFEKALRNLKEAYNGSLSKVDIFAGGMLEGTPTGPGELFKTVIREQFSRLRDADRFWFENEHNHLFTKEEIATIRRFKFSDIIRNTTGISVDIQDDVFFWKNGDKCPQPKQMRVEDLEPCTEHRGFDYFHGSETSFVASLVALGLVPFICIAVAYVIYLCKKHRTKKVKRTLHMNKLKAMVRGKSGNIVATEWTGPKDLPRNVEIRTDDHQCGIFIMSTKGAKLRYLDLRGFEEVNVWLSSNKGRTMMMIQIPNEYDLVVHFESEDERTILLGKLRQLLNTYGKSLQSYESKQQYILSRAVTKKRRQQLLEKFFKTIFSEALNIEPDRITENDIEMSHTKDIMNLELSKNEFAEALALKPSSMFVDQMFAMIDKDKNGYISFREFLNTVVLFSKGTSEEKLHVLFRMYDLDGSGVLNREEIGQLIKSLLEMANTTSSSEEVEGLIQTMFIDAGLAEKTTLCFEEFTQLLSGDMDKILDVSIDWKGTRVSAPRKNNHSKGNTARNDHFRIKTGKYSPAKAKFKDLLHFVENNRQHIFYLILTYGVCCGFFAERFYTYAVEREHTGLRRIASWGVPVSRGSAAALSVCYAIVLLTMCRNTITKLRETFLNLYVPFDSVVAYHKIIAWTGLFFSLAHVVGHALNFYHISTQPIQHLCIFDEVYFKSEILPNFAWWLFGNITGSTGVLLTVILFIMYIFATQTARSYIFNAFWATHKLYIAMYILCILHGSARLLQSPYFWMLILGPAVLFTIDKLVSISRRKMEISVIKAELLPSDVTMIEFKRPPKFDYKSGQWVRIACLPQGRNEYHPFTLTSAPHEDTLMLHIRSVGPWTWNLRNLYDPDNLRDEPYPKLFLDGPYGAGQQDWYQYDVSILVGGGIGVTPYASILKDFVHMSAIKSTFKLKCQKLYFIWVTASQRHYEWLIDILRQVEEVDSNNIVSIHIFITQFFKKFDLRTAMLYICEEHFTKVSGKSLFTGLRATTHFGRPQFEKIFKSVQETSRVNKIGVFSCGPPGVTKSVEKACIECSKTTKALFEHHYENF